jgi:hypothetical protein
MAYHIRILTTRMTPHEMPIFRNFSNESEALSFDNLSPVEDSIKSKK